MLTVPRIPWKWSRCPDNCLVHWHKGAGSYRCRSLRRTVCGAQGACSDDVWRYAANESLLLIQIEMSTFALEGAT